MSLEGVIEEMIERASSRIIPVTISQGKVESVDREKKTCKVTRSQMPTLFNVRLNAVAEPHEDVVTTYPQVGSRVLVAMVENIETDAYVLTCDKIDSIEGKTGDSNFRIAQDIIELNNGENGGLTITPTLVENLEKNNTILQNFLDIINGSPISEPGNGSPSALQAALTGVLSDKSVGEFDSIENAKVKH